MTCGDEQYKEILTLAGGANLGINVALGSSSGGRPARVPNVAATEVNVKADHDNGNQVPPPGPLAHVAPVEGVTYIRTMEILDRRLVQKGIKEVAQVLIQWEHIARDQAFGGVHGCYDGKANASQFMEGLTHVFQAHVDDFIGNLVLSKPNPPISCLITDSFHVWGSTVAKKHNLVNVSLWTEPATVLTVFYHSDLLKSSATLSVMDIMEIAKGIMISKVSFIWVLHHNILVSGERNILPLVFEEETADRGLIVPWCSQLAVLSHPAVGADEHTNRKLVVDDWRIGVNLFTGRLIRREVVAENIGKIMSKSDESRKNIEKTKMILQNSLSDKGSSEKNLNQFIEDMKNKILRKN
ncbi:hypothetical protein RND71_022090 [Anisodus tanguticus]|uniref:Uncharacterized protein n=1 Tax=Anisodus tanguticus TaxID=243964 RepID=A0AAE1VDL1_9SOLA|nr:hypothetical protein RND71_022090 [Anisodus tanguticus]